jgi:hypothetical protein
VTSERAERAAQGARLERVIGLGLRRDRARAQRLDPAEQSGGQGVVDRRQCSGRLLTAAAAQHVEAAVDLAHRLVGRVSAAQHAGGIGARAEAAPNVDVGEPEFGVEQQDAPALPCSRPCLASAWLRLIASQVLPTPRWRRSCG